MKSWVTTVGSLAMVLLFAGGCAMITYARWTQPIVDADAAMDAGDFVRALASYSVAETRFDSLPPLKRFLPSEYDRVVANQLWLLHRLERYDEIIEKAARAPESANPHFWAGAACFKLGRVEKNQSARTAWLGRAQEELRRALDAAPADWDAKFDLELAMRLNQELHRQPQTPPSELMHLLRPEPRPGAVPVKRTG
jgi:tetratricopeptide (TPR) repeat protein